MTSFFLPCPKKDAMRKISITLALAGLLGLCACNDLLEKESDSRKGEIRLRFSEDTALPSRSDIGSIPDTNSFILSIQDASGKSIYEGSYGAAPTSFLTSAGSYSISVKSREFGEPLFNAPQYGDNQVVTVAAGKSVSVLLSCFQLNAGIKLIIDPVFPDDHPSSNLYLKGSDGKLMYSYTEKRTAYFNPGSISLILEEQGKSTTLFTRMVVSQQMLTVRINSAEASESPSSQERTPGMRIQLDTSRFWVSDTYEVGGNYKGNGIESAYNVGQAREMDGASEVWVYGYIVGGDLTTGKCSFEAPFNSKTNLVLASKSSCKDKELCLSVQLSKGDIRDALNLVDHPDLIGRQVFLKGDIVASYYGIPGLQGITEYELR